MQPGLTTTGTHMPYWITQCYLPPVRGDIPGLAPGEVGTRLAMRLSFNLLIRRDNCAEIVYVIET